VVEVEANDVLAHNQEKVLSSAFPGIQNNSRNEGSETLDLNIRSPEHLSLSLSLSLSASPRKRMSTEIHNIRPESHSSHVRV
jgi:hypothetical protein